MAKKTKELEPIEEKKAKVDKTSVAKSVKSKKTASAKSAKVKKTVATSKVTPSKKAETKKENTSKKTENKKASKEKKDKASKTTKSKKTEAKKIKNTTAATKKSTPRKKSTTSNKVATKADFKAEYYDLPFMYNKTVVKVLAQTPKMLFIYWEISDEDRNKLIDSFGENFFNSTKPVLIVYNDTLNYSFEVTIDDFANSWYLHIDDANCEYHVELGRKPISHAQQYNQPVYIPYYIYITSSNEMVSPNNRILFDFNKTIKFKNVKTGQIIEKDINQFKFITNYGIFSIQDLYKYLYPNENFKVENIELTGSSSKSGMFSSQFK